MSRAWPGGGSPQTWRDVRAFLDVELELNDEWQAALTVRLFRTGQWLFRTRTKNPLHALAWRGYVLLDRGWFHLLLNADLPPKIECGVGVRFAHAGRGVIFHQRVRFGQRCTIYHSVTAGLRGESDDVPSFGDDVTLGAGCVVLGNVRVGDGAAIGPHAVVLHDVAARRHVVAPQAVELERDVELPATRATATGRIIPRRQALG